MPFGYNAAWVFHALQMTLEFKNSQNMDLNSIILLVKLCQNSSLQRFNFQNFSGEASYSRATIGPLDRVGIYALCHIYSHQNFA